MDGCNIRYLCRLPALKEILAFRSVHGLASIRLGRQISNHLLVKYAIGPRAFAWKYLLLGHCLKRYSFRTIGPLFKTLAPIGFTFRGVINTFVLAATASCARLFFPGNQVRGSSIARKTPTCSKCIFQG